MSIIVFFVKEHIQIIFLWSEAALWKCKFRIQTQYGIYEWIPLTAPLPQHVVTPLLWSEDTCLGCLDGDSCFKWTASNSFSQHRHLWFKCKTCQIQTQRVSMDGFLSMPGSSQACYSSPSICEITNYPFIRSIPEVTVNPFYWWHQWCQ